MTDEARSLERDDEGFVDRAILRHRAERLSLPEFLEALPHPVLLSPTPGRALVAATATASKRRELSFKRTVISSSADTNSASSPASCAALYDGRVALLRKRPGNPFPQMISVGRAMNNDVVYLLDTVSKFQGYFTTRDGKWFFTDQRSSNGTLIDSTRLEGGTAHPVADGARFRFGLDLVAIFLAPRTLFEKLREGD